MKLKTLEKFRRRFEKLPLHHIDTSVILEPPNTEDGRYCKRYLQRVGYNYKGKISFPSLSEIIISILSLDNYNDRQDTMETIFQLVKTRDIEFYAPKNIAKILLRIIELDKRIEPTDMEIVSCTIEDKADMLITLDKKLIGNQKLEKEFNIKISHPMNLV